MQSNLMWRIVLLSTVALVSACKFSLDRQLEPGEIRGTLRSSLADGSFEPVPNASVRVEGSNLAVRSDSNGRFVLRHLPDGRYRLRMRHERTSGDETLVSALTVDTELAHGEAADLGPLFLNALGSLTGVVSRGGEPESATVAIHGEAVAEADFAAGYTMSRLEAGRHELAVRAMGPNGLQLYTGPTVEILPRVVTVADVLLDQLTLAPPASVSVRVRLSDGGDPSGVDLELHDGTAMFRLPPTGPDGSVSNVDVLAGIYTMVAKKEGYLPARLTALVLSGEVRTPDIVLTPDACRPGSTQTHCGDIATGDSDGDGIRDHLDHCPDDALNQCAPGVPPVPDAPRFCASGLQDRNGDGVCSPDCSAVSCGARQVCNDATGTALCGCVSGHIGDKCVPEGAGPALYFSTSPSSATAGASLSSVSVELIDGLGSLVVGSSSPVTVTLASAGAATLAGTTTVTPANGVATFSDLVIEKAGRGYTLIATALDFGGDESRTFNIKHAAFAPAGSRLLLTGNGAFADGIDAASLTVEAADAFGNPTWGTPVSLSSSMAGDIIAPVSGETGISGKFVALLKSTTAGTRTISAQVAGHPFTADVTLVTGTAGETTVTLAVSKESVTADSSDSTILTVTVQNSNGTAVSGQNVSLESTGEANTFTPISGKTNSAGIFTAQLSSTKAEVKEIMARVGALAQTATVTFLPGAPDAAKSTVVLSATNLPANGVTAAMVYVTVHDAFENPVPDAEVSLSASGSGHELTQPAPTDGGGWTFGTIVSNSPGTKTISVSAEGVLLATALQVTFTPPISIGGTVAGLSGPSLTLTLNGADSVEVMADGDFSFPSMLYEGDTYAVTIPTQPAGQGCAVVRGTGIVEDTAIDGIEVRCGTPWTQVVSGVTATHTLGIRKDGSLWAWGDNEGGQLGDGTAIEQRVPKPVPTLTGKTFIAAAANAIHSYAIEDGGALWAWGFNGGGLVGDGSTDPRHFPVAIAQATRFTAVSAGHFHAVALDTDGAVWTWGNNGYGQLGDGTSAPSLVPKKVASPETFTAIIAGGYHTLALDVNGAVWAWGYNENGEMGDGSTGHNFVPTKVEAEATFVAVAAGEHHSLALDDDGKLWTWGRNIDAYSAPLLVPERVTVSFRPGTKFTSIAAAGFYNLASDETGAAWGWGANNKGQLGSGFSGMTAPAPIGLETNISRVSAGASHGLAVGDSGTLWAWGDNAKGQLGSGSLHQRLTPVSVKPETKFTTVTGGSTHSLALDENGALWGWGNNASGMLGDTTGDGITTRRLFPIPIVEGTKFKDVAANSYYSLALDEGGSLWGWGNNVYGVFGNGSTMPEYAPVVSMPNTTFTTLSAGQSSVFAIDAGGALWGWGDNEYTQLGDGTDVQRLVPVAIKPETKFIAVSAGAGHTLAVDDAGFLWAWGRNDDGQLGDGSWVTRSTPTLVSSAKTFSAVSTGTNHSLALADDGSLWSWGSSQYGQLGDDTYATKNTPQPVLPTQSFTAISASSAQSFAIDDGGVLWAWGNNQSGELGNGSVTTTPTPQAVASPTNFASVSASQSHTLALDEFGGVWNWGSNTFGQLGTGEAATYPYPVFIP